MMVSSIPPSSAPFVCSEEGEGPSPSPEPAVKEMPLIVGSVTSFLNRSRSKREYTSSFSNLTVSRSNVVRGSSSAMVQPNLEKDPSLTTEESKELKDRLLYHASLRVQLFYHLCVAYWKEGVSVERERTVMQHGVGLFPQTAAAHGCILPNVRDDFWVQLEQRINKEGVRSLDGQRLKALGCSEQKLAQLKKQLQTGKRHQRPWVSLQQELSLSETGAMLGPETQFYQSMNSTVVLPQFVGALDGCFEKVMRGKAEGVLNEVSQQGVHPIEATQRFIQESLSCLQESLKDGKEAMKRIGELSQKEGALIQAEGRLRSVNVKDLPQCVSALKEYVTAVRELREVQGSFSLLTHTLSYSPKLKKRYKPLAASIHEADFLLRFTPQKLEQHFNHVLVKQPKRALRVVKKLKAHFHKRLWQPSSLQPLLDEAKAVVASLEILIEGTQLDEVNYLFYSTQGGELRKKTDEELLEEKWQLIKRRAVWRYQDGDFPLEVQEQKALLST